MKLNNIYKICYLVVLVGIMLLIGSLIAASDTMGIIASWLIFPGVLVAFVVFLINRIREKRKS